MHATSTNRTRAISILDYIIGNDGSRYNTDKSSITEFSDQDTKIAYDVKAKKSCSIRTKEDLYQHKNRHKPQKQFKYLPHPLSCFFKHKLTPNS